MKMRTHEITKTTNSKEPILLLCFHICCFVLLHKTPVTCFCELLSWNLTLLLLFRSF